MKKCGDCYYMLACQLWNRGSMINTNADECLMYTTLIETSAFYLGFCYAKKDEWIPVTETLPPADEWVLVTVENMLGHRWVERATYSHKTASWSDGKFGIGGVMAWMKLPDPYGGEE